jgi:site-specific DNA-methyltransferase (cytosine-N4-specific)
MKKVYRKKTGWDYTFVEDVPAQYFTLPSNEIPVRIILGDTRTEIRKIPDSTFQTAITSPPYWGLRDYKHDQQIGAEPLIEDYIRNLVWVFREVRRVLNPEGTFWLNVANCYTSGGRKWRQSDRKNKGRAMSYRPDTPEGLKKKDLIGVAWMLAMALQLDGWYLRSDIIWHKPNCQPESVKDRVTNSHEYLFMFSKSEKYLFNQEAIKEPAVNGKDYKNKRSVWVINTEACPETHYAVFPKELVRPCILAGSRQADIIFDPFFGTGTVGVVALETGRRCVGIELKRDYITIAQKKLKGIQPALFANMII